MKKLIIFLALFMMCFVGLNTALYADDFPSKDFTFIIPFGAGGSTDYMARMLAPEFEKLIGKKVTIVTKPGGGGAIAMNFAKAAKPDGYTLILSSLGPSTLTPNRSNVGFETPKDFRGVARVNTTAFAIAVNADSPYKSLPELLDAAKKNPGKLTYGNAGAGLYHHLYMAGFLFDQGVEMTHVPYNGGAETLAALLGNHIDSSIQVTAEFLTNYEAGTVRILATSGPEREKEYQDVPTMKELGYKGTITWTGFMVPKATPDEVVEKLDEILKQALSSPEVAAKYEKRAIAIDYQGHQELTDTMYRQYEENKKLLENLGMVEK